MLSVMRTLGAAGLVLSLSGVAGAAEPAGQAWSSNADEVRALVAEMLADAEGRSSLLQGGGNAGHDGKFFLASADGQFRMNVSGQVQLRYIANFRDDEDGAVDDFDGGFAMSRTAIRFDGNIIDSSWIYAVQANFENETGDFELEDAYFGKVLDNGLIILAGQYREPILWEDVLTETKSLAVDRSVMGTTFAQERAQGIWLHYPQDTWRVWAGINGGVRSENTSFTGQPADWGATSRAEWKQAGEWSQFDQFTSEPGSDFGMKVGAGIHFEQTKYSPMTPATDILAWTADVMMAGDGWSAFVAGTGFHFSNVGGSGAFDDYGFLAQGSFYVTDKTEGFLRYDVVIPDGDRVGDDPFNTFTIGANHYLHGQAAKFTIDLQWFFDDTVNNDLVAGLAADPRGAAIGLLPSADSDQIAIRMQFQLLF